MADRHNLCTNPALKNNNTGWGGGSTPARGTVSGFGRTTAAQYTTGTYLSTATGAATPGNDYTCSLYIRANNFNVNSGTIYIEWTRSSGGPTYTSTSYTLTSGVVTRLNITGTAPALTTAAGIICDGFNASVNQIDATMVLIEQTASLDTYFDGDTANATWDGADGNSASTLAGFATVTGTAAASLTLTATATGARTVLGTAAASPALTATAAGARTVLGTAAFTGTLTASAIGSVANLPDLDGTLTAASTLAGTLTTTSTLAGTLTVSGALAGTLA